MNPLYRPRWTHAAVLTGALACAPAALAGPADLSLDATLAARAGARAGRSRVIVQVTDRACLDRVLAAPGATRGPTLGMAGAQVADVPNALLHDLARCASSVHADRPVAATMARTAEAAPAGFRWQDLGATGAGVGVAVIDSGVTGWHDDLTPRTAANAAQRVVHFADFVNFLPLAYDDYGHGTHVAGIIAGNGHDSGGARAGVAPDASIIALKVLDAAGHGYISNVIAAIDYAVATRRQYNIRVINLSVGAEVEQSYDRDPLAQAARRAVDAGIVVVTAAGNRDPDGDRGEPAGDITSPGNAPWVLTVGASGDRGSRRRGDAGVAPFSSRGPTPVDLAAKPDIVAPGVGIESLADAHSLFYRRYESSLVAGTIPTATLPYLSLTGTSMAAPVVAGTVALMLEISPTLTPNAIKAILEYTADVRPDDDFLTQGAGLLNVRGAIRLAERFATPHEEGDLSFTDAIGDEAVVWSRHLIWGNYRIGGGLITPGVNAWALGVRWGATAAPDGEAIVWGRLLDEASGPGRGPGDEAPAPWGRGMDTAVVWGAGCGRPDCDGPAGGGSGTWQNVVWGEACGGFDCRRASTDGGGGRVDARVRAQDSR